MSRQEDAKQLQEQTNGNEGVEAKLMVRDGRLRCLLGYNKVGESEPSRVGNK